MSRGLRRAITSLVVMVVAGCSSSTTGTSPGTADSLPPLGPTADCSAVLDDRDSAIFAAGRDASTDALVAASRSEELPSPADRADTRAAMLAGRDDLAGERDRLSTASTGDSVRVEILHAFDRTIEILDERARALEDSGDPATIRRGIGESYGFDVVLGDLDARQAGRDCEMLLSYPGPDPQYRAFQVAAADTCSRIVDRREASGFREHSEENLALLLEVIDGRTVEPTEDRLAALRALGDEWRQTLDDLESVPTEQVPDAGVWQSLLELPRQRVQLFADRSTALRSGDPAAITAAYDGERMRSTPGWDGWDLLGLDLRDCRSIEP